MGRLSRNTGRKAGREGCCRLFHPGLEAKDGGGPPAAGGARRSQDRPGGPPVGESVGSSLSVPVTGVLQPLCLRELGRVAGVLLCLKHGWGVRVPGSC